MKAAGTETSHNPEIETLLYRVGSGADATVRGLRRCDHEEEQERAAAMSLHDSDGQPARFAEWCRKLRGPGDQRRHIYMIERWMASVGSPWKDRE